MPIFTYEELHSTLNHRKTKALFSETCTPDQTPIMTLGRRPKDGLVVLRDFFIEYTTLDPTEYDFAVEVFGDYAFWENLSQATWIQPHLEEWRMVADVRRKSIAFGTLLRDVQEGKPSAPSSAKFLIEEGWKNKRKKEVREKSQKTTETAASFYNEDVRRMKDFM